MEVKQYAKRIGMSGLAFAAGAAISAAGAQQHERIDTEIGYVHQDHGRFGDALDTVAHVGVLNGQVLWNLFNDGVTTAKRNGDAPDVKRPLSGVEVVVMDAEYALGAIATGAGAVLLFPGTTLAAAGALSGETRRRH